MNGIYKISSWIRTYQRSKKKKYPSMVETRLGMYHQTNPDILKTLENFMMISYIGTQLGIFSRIKFMRDTKDMLKLVAAIAEEHYNITDGADGNLNYLWYMYHKGSKKDEFRPFVYMAELMLLNKYNYLNDAEVRNIVSMMKSDDRDNLAIVTLSIQSLRDLRIKEHGVYSKDNEAYKDLNYTYAFEILNHTVFMQTMAER
jgi:hypothetical protein